MQLSGNICLRSQANSISHTFLLKDGKQIAKEIQWHRCRTSVWIWCQFDAATWLNSSWKPCRKCFKEYKPCLQWNQETEKPALLSPFTYRNCEAPPRDWTSEIRKLFPHKGIYHFIGKEATVSRNEIEGGGALKVLGGSDGSELAYVTNCQ